MTFPRRASTFFLVSIAFLASVLFYAPLFLAFDATGYADWQMIHHNWEVGFVALTRFHEWPLFDPYHCGGVTMLGNPESQHFSPLFLLALLVRPTLAAKLFVALHGTAAFVFAYAYGRDVLSASRTASVLLAATFAFSGFFAHQIGVGHVTFVSFAFLPAILLCFRRAEHDVRFAVYVALWVALTIAEGGTYPLPYMMIPLAIETLVRIVERPDATWRIVRPAFIAFPLAGLVAAIRVVPMLVTLHRVPRTVPSLDVSTVIDVLEMLTARVGTHPDFRLEHEFGWHEYGAYVGYGVLALALVGACIACTTRRSSRELAPLVGAIVALGLVLGNVSPLHPWSLLRHLPVYDSLRVPTRFLVVLAFHLGCLAAIAIDAIARPGGSRVARASRLVAAIVVALVGADLAVVTHPIGKTPTNPPIDAATIAPAFRLVPVDYDATYASLPRQHRGTVHCYVGGMEWPISRALWVDGTAYARVLDRAGLVAASDRTTNTATARVTMERPGLLVFDQNFDPDFVTSVGRLEDHEGLLAVALPAGAHVVRVAYAPRYLLPSIVATVLGLALSLFIVRRKGLRT